MRLKGKYFTNCKVLCLCKRMPSARLRKAFVEGFEGENEREPGVRGLGWGREGEPLAHTAGAGLRCGMLVVEGVGCGGHKQGDRETCRKSCLEAPSQRPKPITAVHRGEGEGGSRSS